MFSRQKISVKGGNKPEELWTICDDCSVAWHRFHLILLTSLAASFSWHLLLPYISFSFHLFVLTALALETSPFWHFFCWHFFLLTSLRLGMLLKGIWQGKCKQQNIEIHIAKQNHCDSNSRATIGLQTAIAPARTCTASGVARTAEAFLKGIWTWKQLGREMHPTRFEHPITELLTPLDCKTQQKKTHVKSYLAAALFDCRAQPLDCRTPRNLNVRSKHYIAKHSRERSQSHLAVRMRSILTQFQWAEFQRVAKHNSISTRRY